DLGAADLHELLGLQDLDGLLLGRRELDLLGGGRALLDGLTLLTDRGGIALLRRGAEEVVELVVGGLLEHRRRVGRRVQGRGGGPGGGTRERPRRDKNGGEGLHARLHQKSYRRGFIFGRKKVMPTEAVNWVTRRMPSGGFSMS